MKDTSDAVENKYRRMLLERSGEERLKMGCSMHATAQALVRASILHADPVASPAVLRKALFLRFYGQDFDAATRKKILRALEEVSPSKRQRMTPPESSKRKIGFLVKERAARYGKR